VALSTYTELKASIAAWAARTDAEFAAAVPDMVRLAEARFDRELRCRDQSVTVTGTLAEADAGTLAIPSGLIEPILLRLDQTTPERPLFYYPASGLIGAFTAQDEPRYLAVVGANFIIRPVPDGDYSYVLDYYAEIPKLASQGSGTNWLLTKAPDLYLFASLGYAAPYLIEDDRMPMWQEYVSAAISSMNLASQRVKRSGALIQRVA
jgi:hypothetical protein